MARIELVIFDLDGTLVDSLPDLADAINHVLAIFGRPQITPQQVQKLVGQGARNLVERAMAGASPQDIDRGLQLFLEYNDAHIADKTIIYSGVTETLKLLKNQGKQLAVISNKNAALCRKLLGALRLEHFFDEIMGADSLPFRKPSPEPILYLLRNLALAADQSIMVGDSINDIAAGKGAGIVTVACRYGYGGPGEIEQADYRIDTFVELLELPILKM